MPRKFPKPFFRSARNCWFVQIGGKQVRLHPDEAEAMRLYHALMAKRTRPATKANNSTLTAPAAIRVASDDTLSTFELFEKYLAWCEKHRAGRTFEWYRDHIQSFVEHIGRTVLEPYTAIKPFMVVEWADSHEAWGDSYRRGAITAIQRTFNWAANLGYIDATPIRRIEKPTPGRRESAVTAADWTKIKAHYPDGDPFIDLLEFAWETGCRPQEAKKVEARHLQLDRHRVVFPPDEAKGKKRTRVIHLTPKAEEIVRRLAAAHRKGPIFINAAGNPWSAQAMACRFFRLKEHLGVKFAAYDFRHGFCQRLLESGADHLTVAALMGHADGKMVASVYSHMGTADDHLRKTLTKADGPKADGGEQPSPASSA